MVTTKLWMKMWNCAHIIELLGIQLPSVYTLSAILQTSFYKDEAIEAPHAVILGAGGKGINASALQETSLKGGSLPSLSQIRPQLPRGIAFFSVFPTMGVRNWNSQHKQQTLSYDRIHICTRLVSSISKAQQPKDSHRQGIQSGMTKVLIS